MALISTVALILLTASLLLYISVSKGFLFHLVISLSVIPTFLRFLMAEINIHERYIIFDLLIKFSMTLFSLYLPIYKFAFISYKEAVLIWILQLGFLKFGHFLVKKRMEFEAEQPINED